jgi:alkylhydroperoxidase/carboxymuconolactone decarboxylase family protein YurZ
LDNGVTKSEISEVILHTTMYAGWPVGANAVKVAKAVFDERGI